MENFAYRCGPDWVLWNTGPWNSKGWIALNAIYVHTTPGIKRRSFSLGWNGERLAQNSELDRLATFDPDAPDLLQMFLEKTVKHDGAR